MAGRLKISQCRGFSREYYTCPANGQFGLHDGRGGHICERCDSCESIEYRPDRVEIRCCYPNVAPDKQ